MDGRNPSQHHLEPMTKRHSLLVCTGESLSSRIPSPSRPLKESTSCRVDPLDFLARSPKRPKTRSPRRVLSCPRLSLKQTGVPEFEGQAYELKDGCALIFGTSFGWVGVLGKETPNLDPTSTPPHPAPPHRARLRRSPTPRRLRPHRRRTGRPSGRLR